MADSQFVNTENEKISVKKLTTPRFKSKYVLCIHDDHPSEVVAIHLLDGQSIDWLLTQLNAIKQECTDASKIN